MANDLTALNSLRQALTPYEDVKFELNLNRHPKAHKNKSIVYAANMKLSKDGAVLENEESIETNQYIDDILKKYYADGYKIIHIIPCNTELVLFVKGENTNNFEIWRYREKTNTYDEKLALFYNIGIVYNGGKFSGTFTYTSNDSLIIAFCEYDSPNDIMNPMMTINLGTFTKGSYNRPVDHDIHLKYLWESAIGEFNDRDLETYKLPICPEVSLPQISNINNVKGNSYIGTYYVYIRYKINKYDYTQWFNIGYPIINEYKQDTIIHQKVTTNDKNRSDNNEEELIGTNATLSKTKLNTYINQNIDLINNCLNINIKHNDILYDYCQIGFICIAKTYTKYFITSDIKMSTDIKISTDINKIKEEIFNTNIYENYYNVKNIINKNNKLYISNYNTFNSTKNVNIDNINLSLYKGVTIKNETKKLNEIITINNINFNVKDILNVKYKTFTYPKNNNTLTKTTIKFVNFAYYCKLIGREELVQGGKYAFTSFNGAVTNYFKIENIYIGIKMIYVDKSATIDSNDFEGFIKIFYNTSNMVPIYNEIKYDVNGNQYSDFEKTNIEFTAPDGTIINSNDLNNISTNIINIEDYYSNEIYYKNNLDNQINNNIITGLCQGEVYDFYIHFIDKYGHITDGYKLKNKDKYFEGYFTYNENNAIGTTPERHKLCFYKYDDKICVFPADKNIFIYSNDKWEINIKEWFVKVLNDDKLNIKHTINTTLNPGDTAIVEPYVSNISIADEETFNKVKSYLDNLLYLPENILKYLTYGDIFDIHIDQNWNDMYVEKESELRFIPYYNSQGEEFFKVPKITSIEGDIQLGLKVEIGDIADYGDYISYFISHKKLEKTYTLNGIGTKNQLNNILLNNKFETGNVIKLYNIKEVYDFDGVNSITWTLQTNILYNNGFKSYTNLLNKIAYAQDSQYNRTDRNTTLYLSDDLKEFANTIIDDGETDYISYIEILNLDKNKYINNKSLYRLGNIEYTDCIINEGLNGKYDKHLALRYGNELEGVVNTLSDTGSGSYGDVRLFEIFGFFDFNDLGIYLSEKPKSHKIFINDEDLGTDTFYEVITTLNLFNYKISNIYDTWINFYNVFNKDDDYLKEFNRTIYRSAVISDEGRTNNWRWFENDAYKNIEENKGNITNLLAIGNYLYVHTEHSLFAFSEDNTLSMNNQNLQVTTPDIFDTEYKEVFITKLGYGGLQDKDAWIAGQFGYIWFDGDTKKIYKVYGNSMDITSNDIQEWLENCNIVNIRFANDIINNRILINIAIKDKNLNIKNFTLSYNILSKTFISFHDYHFTKSYNTKNKLYYLTNDTIDQYNKNNYGNNVGISKRYSVSFIVNNYYNVIKYLEYIIYKLRKRNIKTEDYIPSLIPSGNDFPVEQGLVPYEGTGIRVFNDIIDTGNIAFNSIDSETNKPKNTVDKFKTPYWDLGNWNFNYLRDINNSLDSRLYGNYFVIHFFFGDVNTLIEFENFDVQLTKDKNL